MKGNAFHGGMPFVVVRLASHDHNLMSIWKKDRSGVSPRLTKLRSLATNHVHGDWFAFHVLAGYVGSSTIFLEKL